MTSPKKTQTYLLFCDFLFRKQIIMKAIRRMPEINNDLWVQVHF